jgi:dihydrofolate reductase
MRRVRYAVAVSLDGFIAGPKGEADWILMDPEIDFKAIFAQYDTMLVGRKTFEAMGAQGGGGGWGMKTYVFSRTLRQAEHKGVTIVGEKAMETVAALRKEEGKDIWLFGGGLLFRSLANEGLVDTVEVAVEPVILGGGIPLIEAQFAPLKLRLTGHRVYSKTGTVSLVYELAGAS